MTEIPTIDIGPFLHGSENDREQVGALVADACERIGFLIIGGHGIEQFELARVLALTEAFFDLPQAEKDRWHPTGIASQRGYHGYETRGLAYTLGQDAPLDLRESLFLGPVDDHREHYAGMPEAASAYAPNIYPDEPAELRESLIALYRRFDRLSADLLRIIARALSLPDDFFRDKIDRHFSIFACHHYPPLPQPPKPGQLRTGAHTDFGALTILAMTEATGGLEVHVGDPGGNGRWIPVRPAPGELVVNLGDMMARWTGDRWVSTLHRVANPGSIEDPASRRQTIGYFMHPNYDAEICCLQTCRPARGGEKYPPITAGAHIEAKIEKSHGAR
ncbi:MAG: isopenicillin N synthase family dioxygenase [Gammaproteobacteria bacterium]